MTNTYELRNKFFLENYNIAITREDFERNFSDNWHFRIIGFLRNQSHHVLFLMRLIVRSNSPLSSHSARKNCSSIGTVQE